MLYSAEATCACLQPILVPMSGSLGLFGSPAMSSAERAQNSNTESIKVSSHAAHRWLSIVLASQLVCHSPYMLFYCTTSYTITLLVPAESLSTKTAINSPPRLTVHLLHVSVARTPWQLVFQHVRAPLGSDAGGYQDQASIMQRCRCAQPTNIQARHFVA